jgi:hypothetical protein
MSRTQNPLHGRRGVALRRRPAGRRRFVIAKAGCTDLWRRGREERSVAWASVRECHMSVFYRRSARPESRSFVRLPRDRTSFGPAKPGSSARLKA